jgi:hypothetical protein
LCQVCNTKFGTRLALLKHLCDRRRKDCWSEIINFPKRFVQMDAEEIGRLDDEDRKARAQGRRAGHSHALAAGGCSRADGRTVGRSSP